MFGFNEFGETTLRDVKHSFVCSEHFTPNHYVTSLAETLCEHKGRRVLKLDGVSTIFKLSENKPQPILSSQRKSRTRETHEVNYMC